MSHILSSIPTAELLGGRLYQYEQDSWLILPTQDLQLLSTSQPVQENMKFKIENILWENQLADLVNHLLAHGAIDISDNSSKDNTSELETKVLDVPLELLLSQLDQLSYYNMTDISKIFSGEIDDVYLNFEDNDTKKYLKKRNASIRVRYKISYNEDKEPTGLKLLLTLKKRHPAINEWEIHIRNCFEEEFDIKDPNFVFSQLQSISLIPDREKQKYRNSFLLENLWAKIDWDDYRSKIKPLAEIELPADEEIVGDRIRDDKWKVAYVQMVMNILWLHQNKTAAYGSRKLHEVYGEKYKYFKNTQA